MSDAITAILDVHDNPRTCNDSQSMLLALATEQPGQLGALMRLALARRSPSSAFLDMTLDLLPDEAVAPVCAEAWRRYRDGERGELLASVIEFASYQAPQVLQDDWGPCWRLPVRMSCSWLRRCGGACRLPLPCSGRRFWPKPMTIAKWRGPGRCCSRRSPRAMPLPAATSLTGAR